MLIIEENDLITRVGRGSAMGDLLRRYWLPCLFSWEVEPDGTPETASEGDEHERRK
jgi:phthalate 4,5-dioxygenase